MNYHPENDTTIEEQEMWEELAEKAGKESGASPCSVKVLEGWMTSADASVRKMKWGIYEIAEIPSLFRFRRKKNNDEFWGGKEPKKVRVTIEIFQANVQDKRP